MSLKKGEGAHLCVNRYVSHLFLCIFTEGDFSTSLNWGKVYPDTKISFCPLMYCALLRYSGSCNHFYYISILFYKHKLLFL